MESEALEDLEGMEVMVEIRVEEVEVDMEVMVEKDIGI